MAHTWFMQQQEARMDGKASEAMDSMNARIMQRLHLTWINMGGYFNDGAGHGYVTPDFEHSVDAALSLVAHDIGFGLYRSGEDEWHVCYRDVFFATDSSASRAICKAWLDAHKNDK